MATAILVSSEIEVGRRIIAALTRAKIPVKVYLWAFIPEVQEWQFMIATPLVDAKGPLGAYADVNKALQKEGVFEDLPLGGIFLRSPNDPVLKLLEKESKAVPRDASRVVNQHISGSFVAEAYVYSGFIDIQEFANTPKGTGSTYYAMYAPYSSPNVPTWAFKNLDDLRLFLVAKLHLNANTVDSSLRELSSRKGASIPNVQLRPRDLRRLPA
jgi:hypothetical protein